MAGHPARQLARMAADAAGELRGYTDPADPFPWELTEDDHRAILPLLDHAIADLAVCIDGIAQATADELVKQQLTEGIGRLLSGCTHLSAASTALSAPGAEPDAEPVITTQPAHLSAADFPAASAGQGRDGGTGPPGRRWPLLTSRGIVGVPFHYGQLKLKNDLHLFVLS